MRTKYKKQSIMVSVISLFVCIAFFPTVVLASTYVYPYSYDKPWGIREYGDLDSFTSADGDVFKVRGQINSVSPFVNIIELNLNYNYVNNPYSGSYVLIKVRYDEYGSYDYINMHIYYHGLPDSQKTTHQIYKTNGQYEYHLVDIRNYEEVKKIKFIGDDWPYNHYLYLDLVQVVYTSGGGGGCPILSVYDGTTYNEEGLLYVHNPEGIDVIASHTLKTEPEAVNRRYQLRLTEHEKTITHIDNVILFGILNNGHLIRLPLISAEHSELGQVRSYLRRSDDRKVDLIGADHNNGISQYVDLEFFAPRYLNFIDYVFKIEGNNVIIK